MPFVPLFDLDGTLIDSDAALMAPFVDLGMAIADLPPLGLPLAEACARAGVAVADYLERYDPTLAQPFPGVADLLAGLERWGLASNKDRSSGHRELARLGWEPEVALFSDDFGGAEKRLGPVLQRMEIAAEGVLFVGDTDHDRACAARAGVSFALAGWNPRARAAARADDVVLDHPSRLLSILTGVGHGEDPRAEEPR